MKIALVWWNERSLQVPCRPNQSCSSAQNPLSTRPVFLWHGGDRAPTSPWPQVLSRLSSHPESIPELFPPSAPPGPELPLARLLRLLLQLDPGGGEKKKKSKYIDV